MNPSEHIDQLIAELTDWRGKAFASIRKSIREADREIIEEWKWMGSPVWSHDGIIAVANAHKGKVKLTFAHGAKLPDPDKLFNAGLIAGRAGARPDHPISGHLDYLEVCRKLLTLELGHRGLNRPRSADS